MKTLLSQFCEEFEGVVRPLLQPLTQAADTLNHVSDKAAIRAILPTVLDVRHHLTTLANKVAEQEAYVLIFGPLKSGKSTLMNAISAAYVSEVTTLPAYPCMVYVSHAEKVSFTVTRYNGDIEEFTDMASMRTLMEWAHNELADRIREVEARGETFDPNVHIPQAIRRVDVRLPANHLAESSAVLVDTPGLYSRMKFGYDRMTREFRNTASCAIFVVKTDNLFLEQVFAEFDDLLKLFSRIFLVVNIDSTKRDLFPDGDLGPSLECENPDRIITAFENLSMSADIKAASESGRLRIYPVDLLQAASGRLKEGPGATSDESGSERFDDFLGDLTEYLNSTDYLVAFLGDSLRQARGLLDELKAVCNRESVRKLAEHVEKLEQETNRLDGTEHAIERLSACAWDQFFGGLGEDLASIAGGRIEKLRDQTSYGLVDALDEWFAGDASFQSLLEDGMRPLLDKSRSDLVETAKGVLQTVAATETAGAQLPELVKRDLEAVGLDLATIGKACLAGLDPAHGLAEARMTVATDRIPVRKGMLDYLLFASQSKIRKRLFGGPGTPVKDIPHQVKLRRLGEPGRQALQDVLEDGFDEFFDNALDHLSNHVLALYVGALRRGIKTELRKVKDGNALRRAAVLRRLNELAEVNAALESLSRSVDGGAADLVQLTARYGETDPSMLDQPVTPELLASVDAQGALMAPLPGDRDEEEGAAEGEASEEHPAAGEATEAHESEGHEAGSATRAEAGSAE